MFCTSFRSALEAKSGKMRFERQANSQQARTCKYWPCAPICPYIELVNEPGRPGAPHAIGPSFFHRPILRWNDIVVEMLEPPDSKFYQAACGFLELGMPPEANKQLEEIDTLTKLVNAEKLQYQALVA